MNIQKICLTANSGGHLNQLLQLRVFLKAYSYYYVTDKSNFSEALAQSEKVYFVEKFVIKECIKKRQFFRPLINIWQSLRVIKQEQPDLIITTGAGTAFGSCLLGRLLGKKVIFIESIARIKCPSTFGKVICQVANVVIVQWKNMLKHYRKAVFAGPIFDLRNVMVQKGQGCKAFRIFVGTGTYKLQFDRLLAALDKLKVREMPELDIIAQVGHSTFRPQNFATFDFAPQEKIHELVTDSDIVICHGGSGSIMDALVRGKKVIAVPRLKGFGEFFDDHQLDIVRELERLGLILAVYDIRHLGRAIRRAESFQPKLQDLGGRFEETLQNAIESVLR